MNKEKQQVNKAVKKAMTKLVGFSMSDQIVLAGGIHVQLMGGFDGIWISTACLKRSANILITNNPKCANDIHSFELEIEAKMASIRKQIMDESNGIYLPDPLDALLNSPIPF